MSKATVCQACFTAFIYIMLMQGQSVHCQTNLYLANEIYNAIHSLPGESLSKSFFKK